jgi:hypothetical protein
MSRFRFIAVEKATYPVVRLCRVLAVSVSGFYARMTRHLTGLPLQSHPPLDRLHRHLERCRDLLTGQPNLDRTDHPLPQILQVRLHPNNLTKPSTSRRPAPEDCCRGRVTLRVGPAGSTSM